MESNIMSKIDPNSWSNPDDVLIKHIHLILDVDFQTQTIRSSAIYELSKIKINATTFDLDSKDLTIDNIREETTGETLEYTLGESHKVFGSKLSIQFSKKVSGETIKIRIDYKTDKSASALQWLTPEQTAGKIHPYLFTHCQAIHARSLLPCQDTPSVKFTYSAEITIPSELTALMSALREEDGGASVKEGKTTYKFKQPIVIPSYLIAFAVGKLESRRIGPRTHVWSEKELIEQAASEFLQTEEFLQVAEQFCGPYEWGIYDLLVLPPSFPFGGMENPCLTFVTPTLLAGDRSLADVVAHEISHSWTGNLVTNSNFEHFWLNEGFTVFLERKILGHISGQQMRHFSALNGLNGLQFCLDRMGPKNPLTQLVIDLKDVNPDDAFSSVPYEKGHTFLFYLESVVGTDRFEPFLKDYIQHFKFRSITTNDFKKYFMDYFEDIKETQKIDWHSWLYTPGLPPVIPNYDRSLIDACEALGRKWLNWSESSSDEDYDINEFLCLSPNQVEAFLNFLNDSPPLPVDALRKMRDLYKLDGIKNCEIQFRWLRLCIKGRWTYQVDRTIKFISSQGRMKYVQPLYRDLYEWPEVRQKAIDNYHKTKPTMMYVTAYVLTKDLCLDEEGKNGSEKLD